MKVNLTCRTVGHTWPMQPLPGPSEDECDRCHAVRRIGADGTRTYIYPADASTVDAVPIRSLAVEIVDGIHGYTYEFSSSPEQHLGEYDWVEERILAAIGESECPSTATA